MLIRSSRLGLLTVVSAALLSGCGGDDADNRETAYSSGGSSVESGESGMAAPGFEGEQSTEAEAALVKAGDVRLCFEAHLNSDHVLDAQPEEEYEEALVEDAEADGFGTMRLDFDGSEDEYGRFSGEPGSSDSDPGYDSGSADRDDPDNYLAAGITMYFMRDSETATTSAGDFAVAASDSDDASSRDAEVEARANVVVTYGDTPTDPQRELVDNCLAAAGDAIEVDGILVGLARNLEGYPDDELLKAKRRYDRLATDPNAPLGDTARKFKPVVDAEVERRGLD